MCKAALGGRIKREFVEVRNFLSIIFACYFNISQTNIEKTNLQQKSTMASKDDMLKHGLIHFDMSEYQFYVHLCVTGGGGVEEAISVTNVTGIQTSS